MTHTTGQLEGLLAGATPGPWRKSPQDGACVISASGYIGHFAVNRNVKADTRLIAAAPSIAAELIAARKRIAELEAGLTFYAESHSQNPNEGPWGMSSTDYGTRARAALGDAQ